MALMSKNYAVLSAIADEMRTTPNLGFWYQGGTGTTVATGPMGKIVDLFGEFGAPRVWFEGPIDEPAIMAAALGSAVYGNPSIAKIPSMATYMVAEMLFNQAGKYYAMHGQQFTCPLVAWMDGSRRIRFSGPQHADVGWEQAFANMPGLIVVTPSTVYDAKGLMTAAIRSPDPVVFCDYNENTGPQDVPEEAYEVEFGKAVVRTQGDAITIVAFAPAAMQVPAAVTELAALGINAEFIDPISLKPLDVDTIEASVRKTGKLLLVDHGHWTLGPTVQVGYEIAERVPGTKMKRLAYPDVPVPGAQHMTRWLTPLTANVVDAVKRMV
jgi:pyruvate/2-oxoglutarate/acetoin dehydrogenase E1 component